MITTLNAVEFFGGAWGGHVFEHKSGAAEICSQARQSTHCRIPLALRGSADPPGAVPKRGAALRTDERRLSQALIRAQNRRAARARRGRSKQ
jgi:hypothetical protein